MKSFIKVIMSAEEAASRQVCCEHSAKAGQETELRIPRQGLHVLWAVLDMEDPLHGFSAPFQDGLRSPPSRAVQSGHWASIYEQCFQAAPANHSNTHCTTHFTLHHIHSNQLNYVQILSIQLLTLHSGITAYLSNFIFLVYLFFSNRSTLTNGIM